MNNPLVNQAAMVLPVFLLSACLGGGGSFDLDSVDTEAPRPAPKYQDVSSEKPKAQKDQGGYGFAMRFKRRNWYQKANPKEDEIKLSENDWEQTDNGNIKNPSKQKNIINALTGNNGGASLQDSSQENQGISKVTDYHNFQYVWSGFFYKRIGTAIEKKDLSITAARSGPDGYIFYKGKDPSRQLPVLGQVTYKGTWDFLTDVKANQKFTDLGNASTKLGDRYSAFSGELDYIVNKDSDKKDGHVGLGLTTEITVDFEKKTLSGKLIKNNRVSNNDANAKHTTQYYSLDATLRGNRFSGKATATDKPKNDGETKEHPFVSDSSSLSGGFFGPQGEELGFRFLSDDKKVAVVGSAKTKDKDANGNTAAASGGTGAAASGGAADTPSESTKLTTVLDAVELKSGGKKVENLDNFSNAAQLVVDGIMIPLLPEASESGNTNQGTNGGTAFTRKFDHTPESDKKDAQAGTQTNGAQTASNTAGDTNGKTKTYEVEVCCSNLNYLKYGMLTRKTAGNTGEGGNGSPTAAQTGAQSMFLQGERTDENKIPTDQNIVYRGSWYGHIASSTSWSGNASNATSGNRAEFTVNFADKKITGTLTADNRQEATFTIDGNIKDNGFEGTAKTAESGFDLDQSNTTRTPKAYITDAKVQGGFYGPKAEELGGWFAYPGDKQTKNATNASGNSSATVVFGAKRQQPVR
ncbi:TPA: transferrin-binding protein-like solute binding protein [Neisseria meningitidis]|uniref:transferrin-binding protein-like solute binding protein n=1 Tax=Neisseria meningitidis TaxID=487 RepID=UPI0021F1748F|nr:transferrin-binding protein-like solute binding protein [Neisseria meningitidis]MCV6718714.1 transferrin-binding protein-like solute binding protein [Neisseria meningitidis]MCV6721163.1 transferrin-binding protein-like solute binding protein [Neisseria meningitidis]MCV6727440.1 transferrin-binding protein-like solute binding protein [Neisseria meningitidis]MCV6737745.1 transferrin-binding protein-like solute binding protein [Neisseria meningitidis]MCV6741867.1 transferrin-binding protein-li